MGIFYRLWKDTFCFLNVITHSAFSHINGCLLASVCGFKFLIIKCSKEEGSFREGCKMISTTLLRIRNSYFSRFKVDEISRSIRSIEYFI